MRVLHFIYDDPENPWVGGGGAERVLEIYRRLVNDVEVTVVAGAYPGARDRVRDGVRYEFVGRPKPYAVSRWSYGREATRRLERDAYDVAVFDFSVYTPIRVPASRPVAHVVHMPIGPSAAGRFGARIGRLIEAREARMLRSARSVSTTSDWMAGQLRALLRPDADVDIVRTGVADRFFRVQRSEGDWLLYYGRFDWYQKGLDVLLEAGAELLRRDPSLRLVIAGRGKDAARLRTAVASLDTAGRMEVIENPPPDEVLELMAGARLLLHPSRFEGYPAVPGEAMAAGLPVIATRVGAVSELAGHPAAMELVAPGEARALLEAATAALHSEERRRAMSELGRRHAQELRWDRVAAEHRAFLERAAAKARPRQAATAPTSLPGSRRSTPDRRRSAPD